MMSNRACSNNKKRPISQKLKPISNKTSIEKDFDKFRHEIYKFGLSGLDKKDQLDARVELAIKLGAKPKSWIKPHQNLGTDNNIVKKKQSTNNNTTINSLTTTIKTGNIRKKQNGKTRKTNKHIKRNKTSST